MWLTSAATIPPPLGGPLDSLPDLCPPHHVMFPPGSLGPEVTSASVRMCPQHPEPVPLAHPLPVLKEALEKVSEHPGGNWVCG